MMELIPYILLGIICPIWVSIVGYTALKITEIFFSDE